MSKSRLQLTWYRTLIPTEMGKYGYIWVDPADHVTVRAHACS